MSQFPTPGPSSEPPRTTSSSSNFKVIFGKALKEYKKKTRQDLTAHPLATQLQACDSPVAILAILQDQVDQFNKSRSSDERLQRWLNPTINVLHAFAETLGEGLSLAFSPAKVIFVGAGVLLQAAKEVEASQDLLIDLFERIENFFRRLEVYTTVPPTPAMTVMMVNIMVEVLDILGTATKEMKQSRAKKFLKKIAGITKLEDGLKKLDKMTNEEARMASVVVLKVAHTIDANVRLVEEKVQAIMDDGKEAATEAKLITQTTAHKLDDLQRRQLFEGLTKWQSPSDPSTNHNTASDRQHEGTSEWFCEGNTFEAWKVTGSLLWIHGKPGSGKSILCSAIINNVETLHNAGLASMAYFYFDFRDVGKQTRGDLLRSLLIQLSSSSDPFCDILSRLYDEYGKGTRQPSDHALMRCLKEMLTLPNQRPVYLIMDALDECPNTSGIPTAREQVLDVVKDLVGLRLSSLRLCVTSRPEVNIRSALEGLACCSVSLHEESGQQNDIAEYIKSVVHSPSDTLMKRWRDDDKDLVIQTLSERADGMFRWVFCQLETLRHCLPQNVPHILSQLPATLDETYERVLTEIGKTNEFYARRLLQCLTVAMRPFRVSELAEILALDFGADEGIPELKENWRWKDLEEAVLTTCSSLVVVVGSGDYGVVQFSHFSVKEFLTSDRLATSSTDIARFHILPEPAHTIVAKACLGILLQPAHDDDRAVAHSHLTGYAASFWMDHTQVEEVWTHVEDGIRRLFDPAKPHLQAWLRFSNIQSSTFFAGYNLYNHCGSPLYYASLCGFRDMAAHLILENPQHVTGPFGRNPSPLAAALHRGHLDIAELLYQAGADLGISNDKDMTLLHDASERGSVDVVRWLFDHGVPDNSQQHSDDTHLHLVEANGHRWHGMTVNQGDGGQNTPLHWASQGGHFEIVRELLRRGADVTARDRMHRTPLHLASHNLYINYDRYSSQYSSKSDTMAETVQLLVDHGADVNALDMTHSTPLYLASISGVPEVVRILIEGGADVKARDETHLAPIHRASLVGDPETVQLLIKHGADVTVHDWTHKTPLHFACSLDRGSIWHYDLKANAKADIVQILIKHGADVTAQDSTHLTPLHMASSYVFAEIVQLLIEHGADVTAQNETHLTPLHLASSSERRGYVGSMLDSEWSIAKAKTMRLLIKHGADVTTQGDAYSTPLHLAASKGDAEAVQILIEHGADVTARDERCMTPLHLASSWNEIYRTGRGGYFVEKSNAKADTVQVLIKHGADVAAQDNTLSTPLHLAAFSGSYAAVCLLLEQGADVTMLDERHKTPLHLASSPALDDWQMFHPSLSKPEERVGTVQLLIHHGAGVTIQDDGHSTPLHLASSSGIPEIVQLLIERGADVTAQDGSRRTPLHLVSSCHYCYRAPSYTDSNAKADTVRLLIHNGADVAAQDETHATPLHLAALSGNAQTVQLLIEHGADVTALDRSKRTILHFATSLVKCHGDHYEVQSQAKIKTVRLLVGQGVEVASQDDTHSTPLHLASSSGVSEVARLLIEHGADVTARDRRHRTPLHLASARDDSDQVHSFGSFYAKANIVKLLIDNGADVTTRDETHSTPLHLASSFGSAEAVRVLIEHGADVTAQDGNLKTPLHLASSRESAETITLFLHGLMNGQDEGPKERLRHTKSKDKADTIQLLIRYGADVTARDDTHSTPLHLASLKGSAESVNILTQHMSDVNARNGNQSTPLHLAASAHLALEGTVVRLLLRHGANVDAKDGKGRTPYEIALLEGNTWIAKLLSDFNASRG